MLVRRLWRDCDFRRKEWGAPRVDAFWVEATEEEAETSVFPHLEPSAIEESRQLSEQYGKLAEQMGSPARSFCFLVAKDLSSVDPFPVHYPIHPMWNAYSPFEAIPSVHITTLDEVLTLAGS